MCRWIAYRGETIPLERYVTAPAHSLVVQSLKALEFDRPHQRRRLRAGLVRRARGARPLSRSAPGLVGREPAPSLPPHPLAPVLRPCARLDRHADHAAELPSVRLRPLDVHAQRPGRRLVADPPPRRGADPGRVLQVAHRHHRFRGGVPGDPGRGRRRPIRSPRPCARSTTLTDMVQRQRHHRAAAVHRGAGRRPRPLRLPLCQRRHGRTRCTTASPAATSSWCPSRSTPTARIWKPVPPGHLIAARAGKPVALEPLPEVPRLAAE